MGVRVRVRMRAGDRSVTAVALANSGFESYEPDVVVPEGLAARLGLLESMRGEYVEVMTAGGELRCPYLRGAVVLGLVLEDRDSPEVLCNVLVHPFEEEVLLSDAVMEELGIEILSPRSGVWRLRDDPPGLRRASAPRTRTGS